MATRVGARLYHSATGDRSMPACLKDVTASIELVTPNDAEIYLEMNQNNYRKLTSSLVDKYAADMNAGMWRFDGTPICITSGGVLSDGQHRLSAIVKSDLPQWCLVVRGLEDGTEASPTKDTGKKRAVHDHMSHAGHKNTVVIAAAIRFLNRLHVKIQKSDSITLSDSMIIALQDKFPAINEAASIGKAAKPGSKAVFAAFIYLASFENRELVVDCMDAFSGRVEVSTYHPFARLSHALSQGSAGRLNRSHVDGMSQFDMTIAAWNHVKRGNLSIKILRAASTQLSPSMEKALREFCI